MDVPEATEKGEEDMESMRPEGDTGANEANRLAKKAEDEDGCGSEKGTPKRPQKRNAQKKDKDSHQKDH